MLIDEFARLNRRAQNAVFTALIVILVVAMYGWLVSPHLKSLFAAERYDSAVDGLAAKKAAVMSEITVETKKLKKLSERFSNAGDRLFTPSQAEQFVGSLQTIFDQTGCTLHSIALVGDDPHGRKKTQHACGIAANSATISVTGQYDNIVRLLEQLQSHTPKVWVNSLEIALADFASGSLRCDMTITIYTIQDKEAVL
jgi:Tfp pilus assembly protein PilO